MKVGLQLIFYFFCWCSVGFCWPDSKHNTSNYVFANSVNFFSQGTVSIFTFQNASKNFVEIGRVDSPNFNTTNEGDMFGVAMDYDDGMLVIGSPLIYQTGYVFAYQFDGKVTAHSKLAPPDQQVDCLFGLSVLLDQKLLFVGAPGANITGAVYAFYFDGNNWVFLQKIIASNLLPWNGFGYSLDFHDDLLFVGAPEVFGEEIGKGGVYLFGYNDTTRQWVEVQEIIPNDLVEGDLFGAAISVDGDFLAVSAPGFDERNQPRVYIFHRVAWGDYEYHQIVTGKATPNSTLGSSLLLHGERLWVGAMGADTIQGLVFVYRYYGNRWSEEFLLEPSDGVPGDDFGSSLALMDYNSTNTNTTEAFIFVGCMMAKNGKGRVYVFNEHEHRWIEYTILDAKEEREMFGYTVIV